MLYFQEFYAGARLDTEVTNYFGEIITAVSVTINITAPTNAINVGMRFRLLGCKGMTISVIFKFDRRKKKVCLLYSHT